MSKRVYFVGIISLLAAVIFGASFAQASEWGGYTLPLGGNANTCSRAAGATLSINVIDNLPTGISGSESFTISVPGVGVVAGYGDGVVEGPAGGPNVITVAVTAAYTVPANSSITVSYTSYRQREFTGDSATYTLDYNCTTGITVSSGLPFNDDRVNQQGAASAALYCIENSGIEVWSIDARGQGAYAFTASNRDISRVAFNPTVNTVVDQALGSRGLIQLYRLTSGEFQLVSPGEAGDDSKVYNFIFPGCIARAG